VLKPFPPSAPLTGTRNGDVTAKRDWLYRAGAAAFLGAAFYHLAAVLIPPFAAVAYPDGYPLWRHGLFIAINVSVACLFLKRSRWVIWLVALMTLQIYNGHGRYAWVAWSHDSRIAWIDVLTVVGATVLLVLLVRARGANPVGSGVG